MATDIPADFNHDEKISQYTSFFHGLSQPNQIFAPMQAIMEGRNKAECKVVGALWYHLSEAIVDILCIALAKLKNPMIRHLVVQTAYEELGETSPDNIHTDLLREMLHKADITDVDILRWSGHEGVNEAISSLKSQLWNAKTDAEICGILLGMEIIAYNNVDCVVDHLSRNEEVSELVRNTPWTTMHHQLEEGHIRRAVSVFVDYIPNLTGQRDSVAAFMSTIRFWEDFWGEIAATVQDMRVAA